MSTIVYTDEVLKFLLENNLDLDYKGEDIFKTPLVLKYYLATNIKSTKLMQLFLTKVKDNNKIYFGNNNYRTYTDLCRMNIIALNINKALEVFNDDNYKLLNVDYLDSQKLIDSLTNENNFYPNSLGFGEVIDNDMLYQIIVTIKELKVADVLKQFILKKFLYNSKIKLFNINCLSLIKEILNNQEYINFISYLDEQVKCSNIYLFYILNRNNIYFVDPSKKDNKIKVKI